PFRPLRAGARRAQAAHDGRAHTNRLALRGGGARRRGAFRRTALSGDARPHTPTAGPLLLEEVVAGFRREEFYRRARGSRLTSKACGHTVLSRSACMPRGT